MTNYLESKFDLSDAAAVSAYDELPLWSSLAGSLLLKHVPLAPDRRVLDVGCGTGFPLLELAGRVGPSARLTGVDVWDAALDRARAKAAAYGVTNVDIRHADATALPFGDASFDLVVSNLGLNNFADAPAAVRECARVLAPGGCIAITTNLQGHMREFYSAFDATLADAGETEVRHSLATHIAHRATVSSVRALFESAGFTVTAVHEESATIRFADGTALFRHYFIRLGFLDAWKSVVKEDRQAAIFTALEQRVNAVAKDAGEIVLTIPLAYLEARR